MLEAAPFKEVIERDTARRLDFNDDFLPNWYFPISDGRRIVLDATPITSCEDSRPTINIAVARDEMHDGSSSWYIGSFIAPHPGSFETQEAQRIGYIEPLFASLVPIEAGQIDAEILVRYTDWAAKQADPELYTIF